MTAIELLAELHARRVAVRAEDGGVLRCRGRRGALYGLEEQIRRSKPELIQLLRDGTIPELIRQLDLEPVHFDRLARVRALGGGWDR